MPTPAPIATVRLLDGRDEGEGEGKVVVSLLVDDVGLIAETEEDKLRTGDVVFVVVALLVDSDLRDEEATIPMVVITDA